MPSRKSKYATFEATFSPLLVFEGTFLRAFGFEDTFLEYPRKRAVGHRDAIVVVSAW